MIISMYQTPRLSIDIRGRWSHRQARAVIKALEPELNSYQWLILLDITGHESPYPQALIALQENRPESQP